MGCGSSKADKSGALQRFTGGKKVVKKKLLSTIEEVDEPVSKISTLESQVSQSALLGPTGTPSQNERKAFPGEDEGAGDAGDAADAGIEPKKPAVSSKPAPMARQLSDLDQ